MPETNNHILIECNFSEAVWVKIADRYQFHPSLKPFKKVPRSNKMSMQTSFSSFGGSFEMNIIKGSLSNKRAPF
jgi:hypothetical protein